MSNFEYDDDKSQANMEKHGIDFLDAQVLWEDPDLLEIRARSDDLDLSTARRANQDQKRINVDFPSWVVESLDREAARIGVTRQSIIKVWLVERLKAEAANKPLNGDAASGAH